MKKFNSYIIEKVRKDPDEEKASKKVYGKDGRVEHKSLADMLKKVNKKSTVKEEQEYIEMLESALISIAEELECSVEELIEKADYSKVHYGFAYSKR